MTPLFDSDVFMVTEYIRPVEMTGPYGVIAVQHQRVLEVCNKVTETAAVISAPYAVNFVFKQIHEWQQKTPTSNEVEVFFGRYNPVSLFPIVRH